MASELTLGEYLRRLRRTKHWGLQELSHAADLSVSHLSRIENDSAVPNADTVVKLANALEGDLDLMLQKADCLPREILERLMRRADDSPVLRRSAGDGGADPTFPRALVEDTDPKIRQALASHFGLSDHDVQGLFHVLQRMARMEPVEREAVLRFLAANAAPTGG
jgi:transcriptional regulator with XRE-family HTH domain